MFGWHLIVIATHKLKYTYQQPPIWSKKMRLIIVRAVAWETETQGCVDTIYDTEDLDVLGSSPTGLDIE